MIFRMNDLENFVETAQCRTMVDAAKKLEISQPALSESIKRLERDLQLTLFYRTRSGITLTPLGQVAFENAKVAISKLYDIPVNQKLVTQSHPVITIGCHPLVASYALPKALSLLERQSVHFTLVLKHDLSRNIQVAIQQGRIDLGLVINPLPSPDLVIRKLGTDEIAVWTSKEKKEHGQIFCCLSLYQTQIILRKWKNHPANLIDSDSLELLCRLTAQGLGYGILPARAVGLLGANNLQRLVTLPSYGDEICLVHRTEFGRGQLDKEIIKAFKVTLS
jgi:DNA-binding transcriptional LysR family regulator